MANLRKFTLVHNQQKERWDLKEDGSGKVIKTFETKDGATAGGALSKAIGPDGGAVKIQKADGKYQEERTFPRSEDPKGSPG